LNIDDWFVGWVERIYADEYRFYAKYFSNQQTQQSLEQSETHLS